MKKKTIQLNLPNYITVQQYKQIVDSKTEGNGERLITGIAALTSMSVEEVKNLPLNTIKNISEDLTELAFPKETFHAVLEFDDKLYGYAHMNQTTLGALGFFLATAGLYLNHTLYLEKKITYRMKMKIQTETLENLSQSIGDGGELYTAFLNPTSYRSLGIKD